MKSEFIKKVVTADTGGNVINDILFLDNGQVLIITAEIIVLYESYEDYEKQYVEKEIGSIIRY